MALLEQHPIHVRRKIALGITAGIGLVLVIVMIFIYTTKKSEPRKSDSAGTAFGRFYATILESTQSYFGRDRGIITK